LTDTTRRNFLSYTLVSLAGLAVAGCSPSDAPGAATGEGPALEAPVEGPRTLVAYFSLPLTDSPDNMNRDEENSTHVVNGEVLGNTQYVAQLIQASLGADLFRIETAEDLPLDFAVLEEQALAEQDANARPELKALIENLADYDTIFIGYPIYWYDLPMPVYTFLDEHDFAGKTIVPFSTHGGSRLSGTVEIINERLSDSTVSTNAYTISRDDMNNAEAEVSTWLGSLS
jgi:flavodoxin